jgi:cytochrome c oxidase assembly factor CtaG
MVGHVVVMFLVPMFLVASGALADSVGGWRRLFARHISSRRAGHVRRAEISLWTATLALNSVMVASHIPLIFNMAMSQPRWMQWVVEPAFVASGCWFFSGLLSAPHQRLNSRLRVQAAAVIITMVEMLVMAMAMSIFTRGPWYHMTGAMGAMKMSLADQQLAAAILWICGDFWAVPLLVMVIRRAVERDGSLLALLDRRVTAR